MHEQGKLLYIYCYVAYTPHGYVPIQTNFHMGLPQIVYCVHMSWLANHAGTCDKGYAVERAENISGHRMYIRYEEVIRGGSLGSVPDSTRRGHFSDSTQVGDDDDDSKGGCVASLHLPAHES